MAVEAPGQEQDTPAPETEIVREWRVACDGSGAALGHPRVWLQISHERGFVECGYCDKKFIHESFADKVT
jgi:uncharacterized Zn-finger protein